MWIRLANDVGTDAGSLVVMLDGVLLLSNMLGWGHLLLMSVGARRYSCKHCQGQLPGCL
jgi:hypothetical protein